MSDLENKVETIEEAIKSKTPEKSTIQIDVELINNITAYLATRPFKEVAHLLIPFVSTNTKENKGE